MSRTSQSKDATADIGYADLISTYLSTSATSLSGPNTNISNAGESHLVLSPSSSFIPMCGPISVLSIRGAAYYILYIYDRTRDTKLYFLVGKSSEEIHAKFEHYVAWSKHGFHRKAFSL